MSDKTEAAPAPAELQIDHYAVREHAACPDCTANRGEACRDREGQGVETHERRIERYVREAAAAAEDVVVSASARGTVSKPEDGSRG